MTLQIVAARNMANKISCLPMLGVAALNPDNGDNKDRLLTEPRASKFPRDRVQRVNVSHVVS